MKSIAGSDKGILECLLRHEGLKRLKANFDAGMGRPLWWIAPKSAGSAATLKAGIEQSFGIWGDARAKNFHHTGLLVKALKKRSREKHPFFFVLPAGMLNYCVPLALDGRVVGVMGLSGVKNGVRQEWTGLLAENIRLILENCVKSEELNRLSATIRPRAIALSTVHTVHRIINSTLNLEELISRLAHLTAQVLRVQRCSIYLVEHGATRLGGNPRGRAGRSALTLKACVGFPKNAELPRRVPFGKGLEGRVARTAEIILRKKLMCIPLIDEDVIGVMIVRYKKDKSGFSYFDQEIMTTLAEEAVIAIKNAQLYEDQRKVTLGTIRSLAVILGTRVSSAMAPDIFLKMVLRVAQELKLNEEEMQALHYATLLKDTAKIGIPDEILKKPTKLTGEEYQLLRDHPIKGAKIVQSFESLKPVAPIILYSREKYDGTGYPEGLKGDDIPMGARILAVINAFEAIIFGRPYRDQSSLTEALDEIKRNSGTQFDPKVVDAFIRIVEKEGFYRFLKHAPRS